MLIYYEIMDNLSIQTYSRGELNINIFCRIFFDIMLAWQYYFFPLVLFFNYTSESIEVMGASLLRSTELSVFFLLVVWISKLMMKSPRQQIFL